MSQSSKKKKVWISILILIILAAAAAGIWFYLHQKPEAEAPLETVALGEAEVGDIVLFGTYEQDNDVSNGEEAIPWTVLAVILISVVWFALWIKKDRKGQAL